jgi:hypothetical protein
MTAGRKTGGRQKGTINKVASARIERLERQGKKLPPEDMLLLAELYVGMAARYQPMNTNPDTGEKTPNKNYNEDRYAFWLGRWGDALKAAAPYYAPRLMAMAVQSNVRIEDKRDQVDPREVMLQIYLEMLHRGELTAKVLAAPKSNGQPSAPVEDAVIVQESDDDIGDGELV